MPKLILIIALIFNHSVTAIELPDLTMSKQLEWAESTDKASERVARFEAFWLAYLPFEDGGINKEMNGYEDGSHICAVIHCAWQLTRSYVNNGNKEKALKMINWLAKNESKSALAPIESTKKMENKAQ